MATTRIWCAWQDSDLAQSIASEEHVRFKVVVDAVCGAVEQAKTEGGPNSWATHVLPWIPIVNNFLEIRNEGLAIEEVQHLVEALWQVVLHSSHDLEVQVRCGTTLSEALRSRKKDLKGLLLPWRPLYELIYKHVVCPVTRFDGSGLAVARHNMLFGLASRGRRFFGAAALPEVWGMLRDTLRNSGQLYEQFEAACWLVMLLPTHDLCSGNWEQLNQMVGEMMEVWGRVPSTFGWNSVWLNVMGRIAKHDWKGVIHWRPHLPALFTALMGLFEVPVGTASGSPPTVRALPVKVLRVFPTLLNHGVRHASRLLVHLLKSSPERPQGGASAAAALANLQHMLCLLEQYFHPSNTGKWSGELHTLLKRSVKAFMKQLAKQGPSPPAWEAVITAETQTAFVELMSKVAAAAQFSKNEGLSRAACFALGQHSYVRPACVLPLVVRRFRSALETSTATHQLAAAINTLALGARPLLLSGWPGPDAEESGPQMLAEAMMALLPGIDANDEGKTSAVLYLYTTVLACIPTLGAPLAASGPAEPLGLPLYVEEWTEEVLTRMMTLLENLDTGPGGQRGADQSHGKAAGGGGSTFLGETGHSMLWHFFFLLFMKVPDDVAQRAVRRLATFALGSVLPAVVQDICSILNEATARFPDLVTSALLRPLMQRLMSDLPDARAQGKASDGSSALSHSAESTLSYLMSLLCNTLAMLDGGRVLALMPELEQLVDGFRQVHSRTIHERTASLLASVVHVLVRHFCQPDTADTSPPGPGGVLLWVDKDGTGFQPPRWQAPSPEQLACAEGLIQKYLLGGCSELQRLCAPDLTQPTPGSHTHKLQLHMALVQIRSMLTGCMTNLREFNINTAGPGAQQQQQQAVCLVASNILVGPPGTREQVAHSLLVACRALQHQDPELLADVVSTSHMLLGNGMMQHSAANSMRHEASKIGHLVAEPAIAGALQGLSTWRRRVPRFVAMMRISQARAERCGAFGFRSWATASCPQLTQLHQLPAVVHELVAEVGALTMHRYSRVRDDAIPFVENVCKRFACLVRPQLVLALAGLADVAAPCLHLPDPAAAGSQQQQGDASLEHRLQQAEEDLFLRVSIAAMTGGAGAGAGGGQEGGGGGGSGGGSRGGSMPDLAALLRSGAGGSTLLAAALKEGQAAARVSSGPDLASLAQGAAGAGAGAGGAAGVESEREGRLLGASRLLQHVLPFWRLLFRDEGFFAATMNSVMASRSYNTSKAQTSIAQLLVHMASRFLHPPGLDYSGPAYQALSQQLMVLGRPANQRTSFRYSLMANILLLLMMPPATSPACTAVVQHMLQLISDNEAVPLRQLAMVGLHVQAHCMVDLGLDNSGVREALSAWLGQPETGEQLLQLLSLSHTVLDATDALHDKRAGQLLAMQNRMLNATFEEIISKVLKAAADKILNWPTSNVGLNGLRDGLFVVSHAHMIHVFASLQPQAAAHTFRAPLQARLVADKLQASNTSEKAEQGSCAEVVAGLLAAGCTAAGPQPATWLLPLVDSAMSSTTLELSDAWALCTRYGLYSLLSSSGAAITLLPAPDSAPRPLALLPKDTAQAALGGLLELVGGRAALGGPALALGSLAQPLQVKRLKYLQQFARELATSGSPHAELPPAVAAFWDSVLQECTALLAVDSLALREQLAGLIVDTLGYFKGSVRGALPRGGRLSRPPTGSPDKASSLMDFEEVGREALTSGVSTPLAMEMADEGEPLVVVVHSSASQLQAQATSLVSTLVRDFGAAAAAVQALRLSDSSHASAGGSNGNGNGNRNGGNGQSSGGASDIVIVDAPGSMSGSLATAAAAPAATAATEADFRVGGLPIAHLGVGLQVVVRTMMSGDLLALRELVLVLLPHLLRLQELAGPELQKLASEAQLALVLSKFMPLCRANVGDVVAAVADAARSELWSCRAAGLVTSQYFWFRQSFLLEHRHTLALQDVVVGRLSDSKAEVRALATATLAGMIKGMKGEEAGELRELMLARARAMFGSGGRTAGTAAAAAGPSLLEKQGVVQGLKAFLMSSPYDIAAWMPAVLMALVRAAGSRQPAQLRTDASKALAEFKRTHEQDALVELREMLGQDQWDSLQAVTSTASYFA